MARVNSVIEPEGIDSFAGATEDAFFPDEVKERQPITDPAMDPSSDRWNPKKYFDAQPKVIIVIPRDVSDSLGDPSGTKRIEVPVGINGYTIKVAKGVPTRVPRDFARIFEDQPGVIQSEIETPGN